jgi:hypothetical protein
MPLADEWGYPIFTDLEVPSALRPEARAAVAACPTLALKLESSLVERPREGCHGYHGCA